MKTFSVLPRRFAAMFAFILAVSLSLPLLAQQSAPNSVQMQRQAMHKLSFLQGRWSGPITIMHGPKETLHFTQTEDVEYKLDGLVLLIQGKSTDAQGNEQFSALATVAYDDASHTYRFRAYHQGHYLDTELSVVPDGFSWGFSAGPAHIANTMHLTAKGEWHEVTDVTVGSSPAHRSMDMKLKHLP